MPINPPYDVTMVCACLRNAHAHSARYRTPRLRNANLVFGPQDRDGAMLVRLGPSLLRTEGLCPKIQGLDVAVDGRGRSGEEKDDERDRDMAGMARIVVYWT